MKVLRNLFLVLNIFLIFSETSVQCRFLDFFTEYPSSRKLSEISLPPSPAPEAAVAYYDSTSIPRAILDVVSFGAVGDGVTDDTQAFKTAWDAACQIESAILLVPKHYTFMIQSTIFTGPCKSSLTFQVIHNFPFQLNV